MSFETLPPRSEQKYTKATPGACSAKLQAVVWHGLCPAFAGDPNAKPQKKFSMIFSTESGATVFQTCSWSWGDRSTYQKFLSAWSGKPLGEDMIDPKKLLGKEVSLVLVENKNGKAKISTAFAAMPSPTPRVFPTEVFIPLFLKNTGDEYEVVAVPGVIVKEQTERQPMSPEATAAIQPQAASAQMPVAGFNAPAAQAVAPVQGNSQSFFSGAAPSVIPPGAVPVNVNDDILPF